MKVIARSTVFATIIAWTLVSISVTSVFAAGPMLGSSTQNSHPGLEAKWKSELSALQRYRFLDSQIPKWTSIWLRVDRSHHARVKKNRYINEVRLVLKQAESIAAQHAGFDEKGNVIDKSQAVQSVQSLSIYLQKMHVLFLHKFNHRVPKHKH
jgi:hypothetical protein